MVTSPAVFTPALPEVEPLSAPEAPPCPPIESTPPATPAAPPPPEIDCAAIPFAP